MDIVELPSLEKTTLPKVDNKTVSSCCIQPKVESVCCTPNESAGNAGDCCEQPSDGSACCSK